VGFSASADATADPGAAAMKFKPVDVPGLLAMLLVVASASALAVPSSAWRVQFDGAAASDGHLVLAVTPDGGKTEKVTVPVGRADSGEQIAHKALVALQEAAGADYAIEQEDGDDLIVRHREGVDLFEIEVVSNTVDGVSVEFEPEW
jgi:hypothetical protein